MSGPAHFCVAVADHVQEHWVKTLLGNDDMKAALLRLDKLTAREDSMILSEIYADVKSLRAGRLSVYAHNFECLCSFRSSGG